MTSDMTDKLSNITFLATNGRKYLSFFFSNHASLLRQTISLSPVYTADCKYAICPEWLGSNPPLTTAIFIKFIVSMMNIR